MLTSATGTSSFVVSYSHSLRWGVGVAGSIGKQLRGWLVRAPLPEHSKQPCNLL